MGAQTQTNPISAPRSHDPAAVPASLGLAVLLRGVAGFAWGYRVSPAPSLRRCVVPGEWPWHLRDGVVLGSLL